MNETINKEQIIAFLRSNKKLLETEFGITKVGLFGSYARNEEQGTSDIDLLIEMPQKSFHHRIELKNFLEQKFGKKVDIGYFDSIRSYIMYYVEKDIVYAWS